MLQMKNVCMLVTSVVSDSLKPNGTVAAKLLCPWGSPGKNTGVGCCALLQGIFQTQGLNPHLFISQALADRFFTTRVTWETHICRIRSDWIRSVAQSCPTLCDPMNPSMPDLPVHHQLPEFTETHIHPVSYAIQPSHPPSSPSPPAPNPSQHQSLFQ